MAWPRRGLNGIRWRCSARCRSTEFLDVTIFTSDTLALSDLLAVLARAGFSVTPGQMVRRTVLDTFDGRLSTAGLRLELREQAGYELVLSGKASAPAQVARPASLATPPTSPRVRSEPGWQKSSSYGLSCRPSPSLHGKRRQGGGIGPGRQGSWSASTDQVTVEGREPIPIGPRVEVEEMTGYARDAEKARDLLRTFGLQRSDDDLVGVAAAAAGAGIGGFRISPTVPLQRGEPALEGFRRLFANLARDGGCHLAGNG